MNEREIIETILRSALSPEGAGVLLWLVVGATLRAVPSASSTFRFWFATGCAFVIPPFAVLLQVALGYTLWSLESMLYAVGIGFLVSQTVHRGSQQLTGAVAAHALNKAVVVTESAPVGTQTIEVQVPATLPHGKATVFVPGFSTTPGAGLTTITTTTNNIPQLEAVHPMPTADVARGGIIEQPSSTIP